MSRERSDTERSLLRLGVLAFLISLGTVAGFAIAWAIIGPPKARGWDVLGVVGPAAWIGAWTGVCVR